MNEKIKACPYCGKIPMVLEGDLLFCGENGCRNTSEYLVREWNSRPTEDELEKRIAELEAKIAVLDGHVREYVQLLGTDLYPGGYQQNYSTRPDGP